MATEKVTQDITFPTEITVVKDKLFSADTRHYIYNVTLAVIPLLIIAGKITQEQAQYILNVAAAVLGFGTAAVASLNKPQRMTVTVDPNAVSSTSSETGHLVPAPKEVKE